LQARASSACTTSGATRMGLASPAGTGGESGIRTHGRFDPSPVFKTGALNRSAISPNFSLLQPRCSRSVAGFASTSWRRPPACRPAGQDRCLKPLGHLSEFFASTTTLLAQRRRFCLHFVEAPSGLSACGSRPVPWIARPSLRILRFYTCAALAASPVLPPLRGGALRPVGLRVKTGALNRSAISPNFSLLQPRCSRSVAGFASTSWRRPPACRPAGQDRCLKPLGHLSELFRFYNHAARAASPVLPPLRGGAFRP